MTGKKGQRRLTFREGTILDKIIQDNASISRAPLAKDRVVVYNDGWDDKRVLEELNRRTGIEFGLSSVTRFRTTHMGALPAAGGNPEGLKKTPSFLVAINRLSARQTILEARLAALEKHLANGGYEPPKLENANPIPVKDLTTSK